MRAHVRIRVHARASSCVCVHQWVRQRAPRLVLEQDKGPAEGSLNPQAHLPVICGAPWPRRPAVEALVPAELLHGSRCRGARFRRGGPCSRRWLDTEAHEHAARKACGRSALCVHVLCVHVLRMQPDAAESHQRLTCP